MAERSPVLLTVLDGWGVREQREHNAIAAAHTPVWDTLLQHYPHALIDASEGEVGLPQGQMGNSEVGHMNIGAGRVVMQDLPRIDAAIDNGTLAASRELRCLIDALRASGGCCHLMGLLSPGGVHSHQRHMTALANILAAAGLKVWVHVFLDGRDTPPRSAREYVQEFERSLDDDTIRIATVSGRYYAMDRDKRWERVERAYRAIAAGQGAVADAALVAIEQSYAEDISDEFLVPAVVGEYAGMRDGDGILMANFRADRAREVLTALLDPEFDGFDRDPLPKYAAALGMVEYSEALNRFLSPVFPPQSLDNILGEVVAKAGKRQLRIAETEKYAHVTFFFNGGREEPFDGEDRILVPSPRVATYDLQPEMSAPEVTDRLVEAIASGKYDLIIANYANTDMVGHTGDFSAAVAAVEAVDACLGRLWEAQKKAGGYWVITADHGNAELMQNSSTGQPHTAHTLQRVPFVLVGEEVRNATSRVHDGRLADIAPTILHLMQLKKPAEMTGKSLLSE